MQLTSKKEQKWGVANHWRYTNHMTLKMTSAQIVETSVNVISNSPPQDYTHPDDRTLLNYDMTPGFKPFTILIIFRRNKAVTWKGVTFNWQSATFFDHWPIKILGFCSFRTEWPIFGTVLPGNCISLKGDMWRYFRVVRGNLQLITSLELENGNVMRNSFTDKIIVTAQTRWF